MDRIPADDPRHHAPHAAASMPRRRLVAAVLVGAVGLIIGAAVGGALAVAHAGTSLPASYTSIGSDETGAQRSTTGGGTSAATSTGITIDQLDGSPDSEHVDPSHDDSPGVGDGRGDHDPASDGRSVSDGFELRGEGGGGPGR